MRKELKDFYQKVYGLSIKDYDYTYRIIKNIIEDRLAMTMQKIIKLGKKADQDHISDVAYYDFLECEYLWHFCLIRLQGIFEGILKQEFFPNKELIGLKSKVKEIERKGFIIDKYKIELIEWGKVRNKLVHEPPEQYRPGTIIESDVKKYLKFIKTLTKIIFNQKTKLGL
ncbi:MAG: hypothetical protein EPN82_02490 [Bacteroidetes bacterium]|nr:MAG: hypothetical protein EPN82_02490 [Bacteroidota bacterium]